MTSKNNILITSLIILSIAILILTLPTFLGFFNQGKRFTYEDGKALFQICEKKENVDLGKKYKEVNTDFRMYLEKYYK